MTVAQASNVIESRSAERLSGPIARATEALCALQKPDGHFVFELEADATIPAEYVLMRHYRGEPVAAELEAKIARYLRRIQAKDGGWPLFHEGASDISASVKAYFALKMIGNDIDAPHMARARGWILDQGGAAKSNVFTRNLLALYGQVPWRAVPVMPVEIMLLPRWFPFHLDKISYWARTVLVPLMVLNGLKPRAKNPKGVGIAELFVVPAEEVKHWPQGGAHQSAAWRKIFAGIDRVLRRLEPHASESMRARAHLRGRGVRHRAAERRGWSRRHLPGDGELAFDARCAWPRRDRPARPHRAKIDREAAGDQGGRGLLPALRLAGVGHGARGPCVARSRRALNARPVLATA